jgi:hypothetical protein
MRLDWLLLTVQAAVLAHAQCDDLFLNQGGSAFGNCLNWCFDTNLSQTQSVVDNCRKEKCGDCPH